MNERLQFARRLCFMKLAAPNFMYSHMPSMAAAMDAWTISRAQQDALAQMRAAQAFPALHATQPAIRAASMGNTDTPYMQFDVVGSPPVHHRRHRHHSG